MDGSSSCCPDPPKRKREDVVFSPTHTTDRISQLPRPILHHILSFLRTKDVVRTGILSKTWYHTSTSFAISDFCQSLVGRPRSGVTMEERIHIFVEFVRKSLQSQCRIYGIIPKFALSMIQHSPHTSSIEDCIQLATQNNVKELDIKLRLNKDRLIMPQTLLSAKELVFLGLSECRLSLSPTHGVPTRPFLRKLCLQHCHVDEQIFQNLTFSCPLLESLFLLYCDELRDISLSGLTKLTEVDIARKFDDTRDIMLEVDVPCLKTLSLFSVRGHCNVDLTACKMFSAKGYRLTSRGSFSPESSLKMGAPSPTTTSRKGLGVLILPSVVIPWWYQVARRMEHFVDLNPQILQQHGFLYQLENSAKVLEPLNSSTTNFARFFTSSINGTNLTPSLVKNKVAPLLFQAFSTIPLVSQILFLGLEGSFFSYYHEGNQDYAIYSNSSNWYKQAVVSTTGIPYGNATESNSSINMVNSSWIQGALKSNQLYASFGRGLNNAQDPLIMNSLNGPGGVISFGFSVAGLFNGSSGLYGGRLLLVSQNGDVLTGEGFVVHDIQVVVSGNSVSFHSNSNRQTEIGKVSCFPIHHDGQVRGSALNINGAKEMVYCYSLQILGLQSVVLLSFPDEDGLASSFGRSNRLALILLIVMVAAIAVFIFIFLLLMLRSARREMHFCAELIKQMEATQQAERKSMNKSLAFARATHDIRTVLASITGLIKLCYNEVHPGSKLLEKMDKSSEDLHCEEELPDFELGKNLVQMYKCKNYLVDLLNSILDTSKIEAGKMQLEEEDFELANLVEHVVDLVHPAAMLKHVDVILDPCDGSILKFSRVRGDRVKLMQVLLNLLNNAVKFTDMGHVSVRGWAQKPSLEEKIIASERNSLWKQFSCLCYKSKEACNDLEAMNERKQDPNSMEFVFEVSDTGKGIPKEKRQSVFENFVQVEETALGKGGTGLGLGIVQSLVRLMGGEIGIVDKEDGENGTCFRFSIFLATLDQVPERGTCSNDNIETGLDSISESVNKYSTLTIRTPPPALTTRTPSPRLSILGSSPRNQGSHVVLLIQSEERRRATHKFMEGLGIKVTVVTQWERLQTTLARIMKTKQSNASSSSSSRKSELGYRSNNSSNRSKDVPLSSMDGADQRLPSFRIGSSTSFVLLVLDASAGPFQELNRAVTEFKRGIHNTFCKVVWLGKRTDDEVIDPNDEIFPKPFHGSRLYQVIRLLPEFGGTLLQAKPAKAKKNKARNVSTDPSSSSSSSKNPQKVVKLTPPIPSHQLIRDTRSSHQIKPSDQIQEHSSDKPLRGMRILVVEDNEVQRMLAEKALEKLGSTAEFCMNGLEALELVRMGLQQHNRLEHHECSSIFLPYDYILMDCQMPIMNGFEATRQIRRVESSYGIHIPIIALTADKASDVADEFKAAGADDIMEKPVDNNRLVELIRAVNTKLQNY